jgi:hypothetical protein
VWRWWQFAERPSPITFAFAIQGINNGRLRRQVSITMRAVIPVLVISLARRTLERIEPAERPCGTNADQKRQQADSETENETSGACIHESPSFPNKDAWSVA